MSAKLKISLLNIVLILWIMGGGCAQAYRPFTQIAEEEPLDDFKLAEILYKKDKYDQAFKHYQNFIQQHPRDDRIPQALLRQGDILFSQKEYTRLEQLFEPFLKQYPQHLQEAEVLRRLGISYYQQGEYHQAITNLKKLLTKYPLGGSYETYSIIAQSFFKLNDYENALVHFQSVMDRYPEAHAVVELKYDMGAAAFSLGKNQLAREYLQAIPEEAISPEETLNLQLMLAKLAEDGEDYRPAWIKLMQAREKMQKSPQFETMNTLEEVDESIRRLITNKLSPEQLEEVIARYPGSFPGGEALLCLIEIADQELNYDQTKVLLAEFLAGFTDHPRYREAWELNQKIEQALLADKSRIGLIIPLTGKFSVYGNMVLKGVELAIEEENREAENRISLIIKDSEGKPALAGQAMQQLITEDRVIGVIGPVLSNSARLAGDVANRLHTPMFTPTASAQGIPELGPYVFRNCITSAQQGQAIAQFAVEKLCLKEFAVLYPRNSYGIEFKDIFCSYLNQLGGKVLGLVTYEEGDTDFRRQAEYLSSVEPEAIFIPDYADKLLLIAPQLAFYANNDKSIEDLPRDVVLDEGESKTEQEAEQQRLATELKEETSSEWWMESGGIEALPPTIIPHKRNPLEVEAAELEPELPAARKIFLLGTNGWYSPQLVREGGKFVEQAVFPTGFYADSPSPIVQEFIGKFKDRFWQTPNLLAAQAYDAARMIVRSLKAGVSDRQTLQQALLNTQNFPGISGVTSFTPEGDSRKELFILGVKNGRIKQLTGDEGWLCALPDYFKQEETLKESIPENEGSPSTTD